MEFGSCGFQEKDVIGGKPVWGDLLFFPSAKVPLMKAHICQDAPRRKHISPSTIRPPVSRNIAPSSFFPVPVLPHFPYPQYIPRSSQQLPSSTYVLLSSSDYRLLWFPSDFCSWKGEISLGELLVVVCEFV